MTLWTIQPDEVYQQIQKTDIYRCDFEKSQMTDLREQYDWLVQEMKARIGEPPEGVFYPVWAWYMWEGARKKPDLRRARWRNGWKGDRFVCMEIEIPDDRVVLSDFDVWSIILLDGLIADSEEEVKRLEMEYDSLTQEDKQEYKAQNWKTVFDLNYVDNGWIHRGDSIQATFWELGKEDIKSVRFFTAATPKPKYLEAEEKRS